RIGPRSRRCARDARADLRTPWRSRAGRRRAASRARRAQPDSVSRDHRRGVRHARADSYDPRPLRGGQRVSGARRRGLRRVRAAWGEYLRLRGLLHAKTGNGSDAYHDFSQSAALLDLLGERYQAALSHLALGRLVAETGARSVAERHLGKALAIFQQLGAERDLADTQSAQALLTSVGTGQY